MATTKSKIDVSGWPKKIEKEDENLILSLYEGHKIPAYQIALKFEINPRYLREWIKNQTGKFFDRGERCTLLK